MCFFSEHSVSKLITNIPVTSGTHSLIDRRRITGNDVALVALRHVALAIIRRFLDTNA